MTQLRLKDLPIHTVGELPSIGEKALPCLLTRPDLSTVFLDEFRGKPMLLNVYPSIDTNICFDSVKKFNAAAPDNLIAACISMDLPFALDRVLKGEKLDNIIFLSDYRAREFGDSYGLTITNGPIAGLLARAVILLDAEQRVVYTQLVEDVSQPVDYDAVLEQIKKISLA